MNIVIGLILGLLLSRWAENLILRSCKRAMDKAKWNTEFLNHYARENGLEPLEKGKIISLRQFDLEKAKEKSQTFEEMLDYGGSEVPEE